MQPIDDHLLRQIFEVVPIAITVLDAEGHIEHANATAEKILRLTKQEISSRSYADPEWKITDFNGDAFPTEQLPFLQVKKTLQPVHNIKHAITHPDGTRLYLSIHAAPLTTPDGHFNGAIATFEDISDKVLADRAAAENENMLQSIFRASPVGIGMEKDRHLVLTNDKLHEICEYSGDELQKQCTKILYPNENAFNVVDKEYHRQIEQFGTGTVETQWKTKSGRIISVLLNSTPLDLNHLEQGSIFSVMDISRRKKLEEDLRHAEKMRAVGQLASGIGHDFNNQLAAIMGFADLLDEDESLPQRVKSYTAGILTSAERAKELTFQLLAFARKGKYLNVSVDLHHIISDLVSFLNRTVNKNIFIVQHLEASQAIVQGDPSLIRNAILNLAINARDAMPDGGTLTFSSANMHFSADSPLGAELKLNPGSYVRISVIDTGKGISDKTQAQIFEPFLSAEDKRTGLGLAAVYGTCKNHGGTVQVHSSPNKGSMFSIFLPLDERTMKIRRSSMSQRLLSNEGAAHILVVDDEAVVRDMTDSILQSLDYNTTLCCDGNEAMEIFKKNPQQFDAVILDIVMPHKDGKTTFFDMKKINPEVKVLISSGYSIDKDAQTLLNAGAKDFIQKPFRVAQLAEKLEMLLTT